MGTSRAMQRGSRRGAVVAAIRARLASRALVAGDRLPSVRGFARQMRVAPSTVVEAYDTLAAEGLIRSRPGSGFFVANAAPTLAPAAGVPESARAVDPFWVSRQSLDAQEGVVRPGCGWLPPSWMPHALLRRGLRQIARGDATVMTDYGVTRGSEILRRQLALRFAAEGLPVDPAHILLTGSGTHAIDLVCRMLLKPEDTVLVNDPGYFNFEALLRVHRVRIVGVPMSPTGPDLDAFEAIVARERPRLYLTNSAIQNPTGARLTAQAAHRLLLIANAHDLTVVEDDIFADLEGDPSPRLAVLDGLRRVVRIGSFSKTLSAALRCGYITARPDWIEDLADVQVATNFGGPSPVAAELIAGMLGDGGYLRHVAGLQRRLARLRPAAAASLASLGIEPWLMPHAGFFLWCRLPEGCDGNELAQAALARGMVLAPGAAFSLDRGQRTFMRFNVAQMEDPGLLDELRDLIGASKAP